MADHRKTSVQVSDPGTDLSASRPELLSSHTELVSPRTAKKQRTDKRRKDPNRARLERKSSSSAMLQIPDPEKLTPIKPHKKASHHKVKASQGLYTRLKSYTFKDVVKIVSLLAISTKHCRSHAVRAAEENSQLRLMSLQQIRQVQRSARSGQELLFDAGYFSSAASKNKYVRLPANAKATLTLPSHQRSLQQLQHVHKLFLQMKLLSQYPHQMQIQLCKVGFYSSFSATRVIIRQGHRPFYFYIIISGTVMINEMTRNETTGEMFVTTRCVLEKGDQFGETALLLNYVRNATVVCQSDVELLVIDKQDFLPMFAAHVKSAQNSNSVIKDVEHIQYLRDDCAAFERFPINVLYTNPMNCVVHYFRKGSVIVREINTDWLYVVKSGTCRVVTAIPLENQLKENAREIIESLRKNGFDEIDIYDLEFNSVDQKEKNNKIRDYIKTPPLSCDRVSHQHCRLNSDFSSNIRTIPEVGKSFSNVGSPPPVSPQTPVLSKVFLFVCVRILKPGDTFGFESLVSETPDISLSVISNNAECVVISKKLYQNFVPPDILISLKARFQNFPYPTCQGINDSLNEQWQWFSYKKHLLKDTLLTNQQTVKG